MNRFLFSLVRLLPPSDREVVLGDLCECEATKTEIFLNLSELVLLRTLQPYADWRVWACLGLIPFLAMLHMGIGIALATQFRHWHMSNYGGTSPFLAEVFRLSLLLLTTSVTSSMSAVLMARRTPIVLLFAALLPTMLCFYQYHQAVGASSFCILFFLLPAIGGVWLAFRRLHPWFLWFTTAALFLALVTDPRLANNRSTLLNASLLMLPALYCSFTLNYRGRNAPA
ncbi:hypothetical protein [Edaphobacter albus]|uniref:hypothetical protein n=1 Tax=Edaphobacter sp. 4G125 TaxID=2763071 RepID=UPI0016469E4C|nr:hypothetical protein [Edaphobacter sp. 4G125]QNI37849.1 hypothetical protein H7846_06140 [Edaphobacter sp. 4G125]